MAETVEIIENDRKFSKVYSLSSQFLAKSHLNWEFSEALRSGLQKTTALSGPELLTARSLFSKVTNQSTMQTSFVYSAP